MHRTINNTRSVHFSICQAHRGRLLRQQAAVLTATQLESDHRREWADALPSPHANVEKDMAESLHQDRHWPTCSNLLNNKSRGYSNGKAASFADK